MSKYQSRKSDTLGKRLVRVTQQPKEGTENAEWPISLYDLTGALSEIQEYLAQLENEFGDYYLSYDGGGEFALRVVSTLDDATMAKWEEQQKRRRENANVKRAKDEADEYSRLEKKFAKAGETDLAKALAEKKEEAVQQAKDLRAKADKRRGK